MTPPEPTRLETLRSGAVVSVWEHASARAVVVLQHGFGEHVARMATQHHQLVGHLLDHGLEVWGADLAGHGRSPGPRAVTDVRAAVDDHLEVRRRAARRGRPVLLVGHSLGGLVTAASVVSDPTNLAGVVLLGAALPAAPPRVVRRMLLAVGAVRPAAELTVLATPLTLLSGVAGHESRTRADPLMHLGALTLLTAATALDVAADVWAGLDHWTVPTLVVHGTADRHTDWRGSRRLHDAIPAADRRLIPVEGGYHELLDDVAGDSTLARLLTWLNGGLP